MFDRSAIMKEAWNRVRKANRDKFSLSFLLRRALRGAWADAKHEAAAEARRNGSSKPKADPAKRAYYEAKLSHANDAWHVAHNRWIETRLSEADEAVIAARRSIDFYNKMLDQLAA